MRLAIHRSGEGSEAGETLIEVLIASALMGIVVVAILGGLATSLLTSSIHREQADANTVLVAAMERVKSNDVTRVPCGTDPSSNYLGAAKYLDTAHTVPATLPQTWIAMGWTPAQIFPAASLVVEHQTLSSSLGATTVDFLPGFAIVPGTPGTCSDALPLQRVTITLRTPDGRVTPALTFIKGGT